jgi:hypothetical protein
MEVISIEEVASGVIESENKPKRDRDSGPKECTSSIKGPYGNASLLPPELIQSLQGSTKLKLLLAKNGAKRDT